MVQAGVKPIAWFAVGAVLQGDWRSPTGAKLAEIMGEQLPYYGIRVASLAAPKAI